MGMTREKAIEILRNLLKELTEDFDALTEEEHEAYDLAISTMLKYQQIEQILKDIPYGGDVTVRRIQKVVEDGSENTRGGRRWVRE